MIYSKQNISFKKVMKKFLTVILACIMVISSVSVFADALPSVHSVEFTSEADSVGADVVFFNPDTTANTAEDKTIDVYKGNANLFLAAYGADNELQNVTITPVSDLKEDLDKRTAASVAVDGETTDVRLFMWTDDTLTPLGYAISHPLKSVTVTSTVDDGATTEGKVRVVDGQVLIQVPAIGYSDGLIIDKTKYSFNIKAESIQGAATLYKNVADTTGTAIGADGVVLNVAEMDEGTKIVCGTKNYPLRIERTFDMDFETGSMFDSTATPRVTKDASGNPTGAYFFYEWIKGYKTGNTPVRAGGISAKYTNGTWSSDYYKAEMNTEMISKALSGISMGAYEVSGNKKKDGTTVMPNAPGANASGKALKISKKYAIDKYTNGAFSGMNTFGMKNVSFAPEITFGTTALNSPVNSLPDLENASELVVEFDIASNYWQNVPKTYDHVSNGITTTDHNNAYGAWMSLVSFKGVDNNSTNFDRIACSSSGSVSYFAKETMDEHDKMFVTGEGSDIGEMYLTSRNSIEQWNHVNVVYKKNDEGTVDVYVNDLKLDRRSSKTNTDKHIQRTSIPTQITFSISGKIANELWIDNLSIRYH